MQIQYCTHKEETTITVTTSEIITAVGAITEVIIGIKDITNILAITKITVIAETIIIRPTTIIEVVVIIEETTVVETPTMQVRAPTDGIIIMSDRYKLRRKTNKIKNPAKNTVHTINLIFNLFVSLKNECTNKLYTLLVDTGADISLIKETSYSFNNVGYTNITQISDVGEGTTNSKGLVSI